MNMNKVTCIEDLRQIHKRRVPKAFFDYLDRGSYSEETYHANCDDFKKLKLRQRVLKDVSARDLRTTILGEEVSLPLMLAPVGLAGLQHVDGEIHACRAAHAAGIPYTLSIMAICSMEVVAAHVDKPFWFQLTILKDRGFVESLIQRAAASKCSAIVLTVDLPVLGQRHADIKNGMTVPPQWSVGKFFDFATKPGWVFSVMRSGRRTFGNLAGQDGNSNIESLAKWTSSQFDSSLNWKHVEWVRKLWPGKLIIKGISDAEDAREAVRVGADAIIVSNHGGRQLDGGRSTIEALPEVAQAVGSDLEVFMDGGVRSGKDVVRALAAGARACMVGRAYVYGLGAGGQQGVAKAIDLIRSELDVTMGLCGVTRVADIDQRVLVAQ
jgi:L-lactate dehydrogenase (FMN-dependent) and related alpha-hydroxy acid dehydrogenases